MKLNKGESILVIDDDEFFATVVCKMLLKLGFMPFRIINVEDAFAFAGDSSVRIVLTDIFMPGMGGIEGISSIKENFPNIKIIAMSGGYGNTGAERTIKAAKKIGADVGLEKPFTPEALAAAIASL
jgi:CheY-like chemotaxis protein